MQGDELVRFYDAAYASDPAHADRYARWRALSALGKADHVERLVRGAGLRPRSVLEVGCGDGALLSELARRGLGDAHSGYEITDAAVALARQRPGLRSVARFDGERLPEPDGAYELGIVSHVLEHVTEPGALLGEVARVCGVVVVEVPLEDNLSARRASKREGAAEVGHLQRFGRGEVRALAGAHGLRVAGELEDPLPLAVHEFFAEGPAARARAGVKWALRAALASAAPGLARRLFTLHYACLCVPVDASA